MAEYRKVQLQRYAANPVRETAEARFWNAFLPFRTPAPAELSLHDQVTHIAFAPSSPFNLAVSSGPRLHVYGGSSCRLLKTVTRFKDKAYSPAFRADGRLLAAGSGDGLVRVFDVKGREVIRTFKGHRRCVRAVAFAPAPAAGAEQVVASASDDSTARLWSMATAEQLARFDGHTDYVRCVRPSAAAGSGAWLTGSYDHSVRAWDPRAPDAERCVLRLDHGAPVEDVLPLAGGSLVASAGGNRLKVWDLLGGRLVYECSNHQKTITSLAQDSGNSRLASASLDGMVKFYDLGDFAVTHSLKFGAPVLAMGLSPNNRVLACGLATGEVALRRRSRAGEGGGGGGGGADKRRSLHLALGGDPSASQAENEAVIGGKLGAGGPRGLRTGTYKYYQRGHQHKPADDDLVVESSRKPRLQEHDKLLKRFRYGEALDAALRTNHGVVVCSVMGELSERGGLRKALAGRDEAGLVPVLRFLNRNVCNPHYSAALIRVADLVLDLYGSALGRSLVVDELFVRLRRRLAEEAAFQKQLLQLSGTLDMLMSAAAAAGHVTAAAAAAADSAAAAVDSGDGGEDAATAARKRAPPSAGDDRGDDAPSSPRKKRSRRSRAAGGAGSEGKKRKQKPAAAAPKTRRSSRRRGATSEE